MILILFGVSGAGKTVVGKRVAQRLGWAFLDADDHHPAENIAKMRTGIPLDDEDRHTVAILRFRTASGLVLALPESVDVTVPWSDIENAVVDLAAGRVLLRIAEAARVKHPWLGRARELRGVWTDRELLKSVPAK